MLKSQKRYFLKLFIPLSIVVFVAITAVCYFTINGHLKAVIGLVQSTINNEENIFRETIDAGVADVLFLKAETLIEYYDHDQRISDNFTSHLAQGFSAFSELPAIYDQIRLIDQRGREIVRINNRDGKINVAPKNKLQNKKHRYYFAKTMDRQKNEIYFSPLDLNVEHKKIEVPFRPMIRIGIPVVSKKGKKLGAIILNYNAQLLLNRLKQSGKSIPGHLFIVNQNGHFILSMNSAHEWGNMLKSRRNITVKKMFPGLWDKINGTHANKAYTKEGVFFIRDVLSTSPILRFGDLKLKIIWFLPWRDLIPGSIKYYLLIFMLLWGAMFFVSWLWSLLKVKQIEHERKLEFLATIDPLTKIANRHELLRIGVLEFDRARRFKGPFSVLMLDIDFFKKINDVYGHLSGDKALIAVAKMLKSNLRKIDFVARFGGEEFVIILPGTTIAAAKAIAEKLRKKIAAIKISVNEKHFAFTVSIGISMWDEKDSNIDAVINRADENLYKAKEGGRNRVVSEVSHII